MYREVVLGIVHNQLGAPQILFQKNSYWSLRAVDADPEYGGSNQERLLFLLFFSFVICSFI